jgi:hypothetical protein
MRRALRNAWSRTAEPEGERQHDVARRAQLRGESGVAGRIVEESGERSRALVVEPARQSPEAVEPGGRHGPGLGLGEQEVEADRPRAGDPQAPDGLGDHAAAPWPATERADARVVDQHQHDLVRGRRRRPQAKAQIEQPRLDLLHQGGPVRRQLADRETQRREQGDPERR